SISGRYLYAANLRSPFWSSIIAASKEEKAMGRIVAAVSMALRERSGTSAATAQTPAEPEIYYQDENAVSINDTSLEVQGKSFPVSSLHFATAYPVVGQSIRDTFTSTGLVGLAFGALNGISSDPQVREVPWVPLIIYLLAGAAISGFLFLVNKRKGGPLAIIHVCWVRTAREDTVAFTSIDQGYTEQVVRAINETVHHLR
ncbi:MAG TPA: DUF6232 family protein, partial [Chloroflexia bacterium]|nr:DUF6232 family protein [Chloroflexia bacterium]